jgi:hypothetical protein
MSPRECWADAEDEQASSTGSIGHPWFCSLPCKYHTRAGARSDIPATVCHSYVIHAAARA